MHEPTKAAFMSVAVIGAGAAGLVTARELVREGFRVQVLEQGRRVGGVWDYCPDAEEDLLGRDPKRTRIHSSLYKSVRTNLPREIMSFSDFPFIPEAMQGASKDPRRFCGHEEVLKYLEVFAEEFDLKPLIRFGQSVINVQPCAEDVACGREQPQWIVSCLSAGDHLEEEGVRRETYDAVVVCVGTYSRPNLPDLPGMDVFPGMQMHSHNYREPSCFQGKTVLVLGASFSGDEIAREIAGAAKHVYVSARTWPKETPKQTRQNIQRMSWVTELTKEGKARFLDLRGHEVDCIVDCIVHCTGYQYSFPFLDDARLLKCEDGHVSPVYKHIFLPQYPNLAFVGLLWKSLRFPQFEIQAKVIAKVLSGRVALPSRQAMESDTLDIYEKLSAHFKPVRYYHNQGEDMPKILGQWAYNDDLCSWAGLDSEKPPQWRRVLDAVLQGSIFGRPETFREKWTAEEEAAFAEAAAECLRLHRRHLALKHTAEGRSLKSVVDAHRYAGAD